MSFWTVAVCALVLATVGFHQASAIECYQCNSHNDSRCMWKELPESMKKPCSAKDTMCRKIVQFIEFDSNGLPPDNRVIRGCGWDDSNYKGRCYQRSGFGGRQEVCSCLNDNCNSAGIPAITAGLVLTSLILVIRNW